jgi:hypothetical protein
MPASGGSNLLAMGRPRIGIRGKIFGFFVYPELKPKPFWPVLARTFRTVLMVFFLITYVPQFTMWLPQFIK